MKLDSSDIPEVITNSPIEFILTSSESGGKKIIAVSENVSLRLKGAEALSNTISNKLNKTLGFYNIIFDEERINRVEHSFYNSISSSTETYHFGKEVSESEENFLYKDDRLVTYSFVWRGRNRKSTNMRVFDEFKKRCLDISKAFNDNDEQTLEWHLSAIIALCDIENQKFKRLRQLYFVSISCYIALIVLSAVIVAFRDKIIP